MAAPTASSSSPVTTFTLNSYTSKVFAFTSPASNEVQALLLNAKWGSSGVGTAATVYYSFPTSSRSDFWSSIYTNRTSEINSGFTATSTAQQSAATEAFQKWGSVANINFVHVENESQYSVGDIRIANTNLPSNYYAYAYYPTESNARGGDIWFNNNQPVANGNDYSLGARGYQVMLHEIGHAIGLDHPFDGDATLSNELDTYQYTIMSYSYIPGQHNRGAIDFYPTSPMLLDIQALQFLYGANTSYNTGNNVYTFTDTQKYYETIWDAGGYDTIQYDSDTNGIINLNAGAFSSLGAPMRTNQDITDPLQNNNVAIAYNVTIESAIGGSGNDIIIQNSASNVIDGRDGYDTVQYNIHSSNISFARQLKSGGFYLESAEGSDTLHNIEKITFTNGEVSIDALTSAMATPSFTIDGQGAVTPTIYNGPVGYIQYQLYANDAGNVITGSSANDFINVFGDDDAVNAGLGDDIIDGGTGSNFLSGGGGDTFFIDGRGTELLSTWSTIADFSNDEVNVWGWVAGTSKLLYNEESNGAEGYKGATYHYDLNNDGNINTSITFTGMSINDIENHLTIKEGVVEGNGYLFIG